MARNKQVPVPSAVPSPVPGASPSPVPSASDVLTIVESRRAAALRVLAPDADGGAIIMFARDAVGKRIANGAIAGAVLVRRSRRDGISVEAMVNMGQRIETARRTVLDMATSAIESHPLGALVGTRRERAPGARIDIDAVLRTLGVRADAHVITTGEAK